MGEAGASRGSKLFRVAVIILLVFICALCCVLIFLYRQKGNSSQQAQVSQEGTVDEQPVSVIESNQVDIKTDKYVMPIAEDDEKNEEEIQQELNDAVEKGMTTISMNTQPEFASGVSKGTLLITNNKSNIYPQIVEIYEAETMEKIYTSGLIPVGTTLAEAKLDVALSAGEYDCIAYFCNVDVESKTIVGKVAAEIKITILK